MPAEAQNPVRLRRTPSGQCPTTPTRRSLRQGLVLPAGSAAEMPNRFLRDSRVIWKSSVFHNVVCGPPTAELPQLLVEITDLVSHKLWE